jgi:hypothetical protein
LAPGMCRAEALYKVHSLLRMAAPTDSFLLSQTNIKVDYLAMGNGMVVLRIHHDITCGDRHALWAL